MLTTEETLEILSREIDRKTLETYIIHQWVKPMATEKDWGFEEIDIARARLVHQLHTDFEVNDDAMDIVLSLMDQLYGLQERMRKIHSVLHKQPEEVRVKLFPSAVPDEM